MCVAFTRVNVRLVQVNLHKHETLSFVTSLLLLRFVNPTCKLCIVDLGRGFYLNISPFSMILLNMPMTFTFDLVDRTCILHLVSYIDFASRLYMLHTTNATIRITSMVNKEAWSQCVEVVKQQCAKVVASIFLELEKHFLCKSC
jgi:hypothetical protein